MIDRDVRLACSQYMQETAPIMPGGAAARIVGLLDEIANLIEGFDVFGVLTESEFDLGLFEYGVDAAHLVRIAVGQGDRAARSASSK